MTPPLPTLAAIVSCLVLPCAANAHGTPINVFLNESTNQLYILPNFDAGPLLPFGDFIATDTPGLGVANPGNRIPAGATLGVSITQPLLYSDGQSLQPAPGELFVYSPTMDGFGRENTSPVERFSVTAATGFQQGMVWGSYQVLPPGWDAHGRYELAFSHVEPGFFGAAAGIYGVVMQVTSPGHLPTEPFLVPLEYDPFGAISRVQATEVAMAMQTLVRPLAAADFDVDGDVDGDDLLDLLLGFGTRQNALRADGDADTDGDVDRLDLAVWRDQAGTGLAGGQLAGPQASVPEPDSIAIVLLLATPTLLIGNRLT